MNKEIDNLFLFTGKHCSGKSTALDVCMENSDIFCYDMREFIQILFQFQSEYDDMDTWASRLRENYGKGYFAQELCNDIAVDVPPTKSVAISGVRSPEEVQAFIESNLFDDVTTISIIANNAVRWERYSEGQHTSQESFEHRNNCDVDLGVEKVIRMSDVHLENSHITKERFRRKVEMRIEELM